MNNNKGKRRRNNIYKSLIISLFILIIFITSVFIYSVATDYQPPKKEIVFKNNFKDTITQKIISVLSWNIGYCGLGKDMDFFYDGGEKVRDSKKATLNNLKKIVSFISKRDTVDFILLQEVDKMSKRSYFINQFDSLKTKLSSYYATFALNYNVKYVPIPLLSPLGKVKAGIVTFSKKRSVISSRYSFPGNFPMPKKSFMLDRCFLENKYQLKNGKKLILVNTHLSAYDNGTLKQQQMQYLKKFIVNEYRKGNYVIVGGDWNQLPSGTSPGKFNKLQTENVVLKNVKKDFLPQSWKWIFDKNTSTNRSLEAKYLPEKTHTSIIDFFVISPNIKGLCVETINLRFENSDHQPIIATFSFKN
ncbi:MAG: endonuclease/exonuclease/phosphatase family protein [Bacteroidetes bacterium]|nr:endonuclease/exonuclease/phosphatase family protein [Bacteroidota bacterium]